MPCCFVPGCKSGYKSNRTGEKRSFFRTPKDLDLFKAWERAVPRDGLSSKSVICDLHFQEDDVIKEFCTIIQGKEVRIPRDSYKLKTGSIPSKFPGCPAYLSKNTKRRKEPAERQVPKAAAKRPRRTARSAEVIEESASSLVSGCTPCDESSIPCRVDSPVAVKQAKVPGEEWGWVKIKNSSNWRCDEVLADESSPLGVSRKTVLVNPELQTIEYYVHSVKYVGSLLKTSYASLDDIEQSLMEFHSLTLYPGCDDHLFRNVTEETTCRTLIR